MNLKDILGSERTRIGKKNLEVTFHNYNSLREETFKRIDKENFIQKIREIKEYSTKNLEELKKKTIRNLQQQGIKVFEAKDRDEICKIALKLIPEKQLVVKSKSNTITEIGLTEVLKKRNEVVETDCGDFIVQLCNDEPSHPIVPALHISPSKIVQKIEERYKVKVKEDPAEIAFWIRNHLRKKILDASIGLTGANIISADGGIFILENEGNISLVSRLPQRHIIIAGIDKIVPTVQDAMNICKAESIWGVGSYLPTYINVISSPSKTSDIQQKLVYGMHATREVFLVLIDNGRSEMIKEGLEELLYCINCGSCMYACPVFKQILDNYGSAYFSGIGVGKTFFQEGVKKAFDKGLYFCSDCLACKVNCPVNIDVPELTRKLRKISVNKGVETPVTQEMMENIRSMGNPFGEAVKEGKIPKRLFCC